MYPVIRDKKSDDAATTFSGTTQPETGSGPNRPPTNQDAAVAVASQVLEEMESLRSEMRMLIKVSTCFGKLAAARVFFHLT